MEVIARQPTELSSDLNILSAEIRAYQRVAGEAIFEIGKRLKYVKENDLARGEFGKWLESINMNDRMARKFMKVATELDEKRTISSDLGLEALYTIATMLPEDREREYVVSSGEEKKVEDMTVKELREVKKQLKAEKERAEKAESNIKSLEAIKNLSLSKAKEDGEKFEEMRKENVELTTQTGKLQKQIDLLESEKDNWLDEKYNLEERISELESAGPEIKEVIIEKEVIKEVVKEVPTESEDVSQLYENYKLLSEELRHTQEQLLRYETRGSEIKGNSEIIEETLPRAIMAMHTLSEQMTLLISLDEGGWSNVDKTLYDTFADKFNAINEQFEHLGNIINLEI